MAYQETKTTGYGTRVKNSCGSIVTGIVLFFAATALLWWNEGRAVKTADMLEEAQGVCVEMANPDKVDRSMDGELVCVSGLATTEDSLVDEQYGIGAKAISLQRKVEYYQYVEHSETKKEDKLGGKEEITTTYTYSKEWVREPIESAQFKDPAYQNKNTVLATVENKDLWAENVTFGAYKLTPALFHSISSKEAFDVVLSDDMLRGIDVLNEREQQVIKNYFGVETEHLTMAEIAQQMQLKRERVRQIRDTALRKLRKAAKNEE